MKKTDIALLILVIAVSGLITYFVANSLLASPKKQSTRVEVVEAISSDITEPDKTIFYKGAINPAVPIQVGNSANQQPF